MKEAGEKVSKIQRLVTAIIFIIFIGFLVVQHQQIFMYFDDYGYASLSYAVSLPEDIGEGVHLIYIIKYCILHWLNWGGRVLFFALEIILLRMGLNWCRLFQVVCLTMIFYMLFKVVVKDRQYNRIAVALMVCFSLGVFEIGVLQHGIYWFTASSIIVWPLLPCLIAFYCYYYEKYKEHKWLCLVTLLCAFAAGFSQEQVAIGSLTVLILIFLSRIYTNTNNKFDLLIVGCNLLGVSFCMLAPGNFKRMAESAGTQSLLERIFSNLGILLNSFFGQGMYIYMVLLLLSLIIILISNQKKCQKRWSGYLNNLVLGISSMFLGLAVIYDKNIFHAFSSKIGPAAAGALFVGYMVLAVFIMIQYALEQDKKLELFLFAGGITSVGMMIVSPAISLRLYIPLMILSIPLLIDSIYTAFSDKKVICVLGAFFLVMGMNLFNVFRGYWENSEINRYNDRVLRNAAHSEQQDFVILKKLPDAEYASSMPYTKGCEWMEGLLRKYYKLDDSVEIFYDSSLEKQKSADVPRILEIYPQKLGNEILYNPDSTLNLGIVMESIDNSLQVWVNNEPYPTEIGSQFISTVLKVEDLKQNAGIRVLDKETREFSDEVVFEKLVKSGEER